MNIVYLALGSNLNDRRANILSAIDQLAKNDVHIEDISSIIETNPVGGPPQEKFLNAVVKATTLVSPENLLNITQSIEKQLGRRKTVPNGPRTIDIDILLYNRERVHTKNLTIPHPRMLEREFVLKPLREIDPVLTEELLACKL